MYQGSFWIVDRDDWVGICVIRIMVDPFISPTYNTSSDTPTKQMQIMILIKNKATSATVKYSSSFFKVKSVGNIHPLWMI